MADKIPNDINDKIEETGNGIIGFAKFLWSQVPPINKAGMPFVAIAAVIGALLWILLDLFALGIFLTLAVYLFFRDPIRQATQGDDLITSPADGLVTAISDVEYPAELEKAPAKKIKRISIFLSVFDVHINRLPANGTITEVVYKPGKFINAKLDKASEDNERSIVLMETPVGPVAFVQIAGLIARRIINDLKAGDVAEQGQRYGLIRFGSRVDVYLPEDVDPVVAVGQHVIGGETVLAAKDDTYYDALKTKEI